jgi:REP element-mobilizing transposase RayT
MHVTMKRVAARSSLRSEPIAAVIRVQIAHAVKRGVRVLHFTIQHDHLHFMIEADDRGSASRGMQLLFSRIAQEVNRIERRHGKVFRDRHHRRALITPSEVRNCIVYVMFNDRKHATSFEVDGWIDPCSSAMWFEDWDPRARPPPQTSSGPSPLARPRTWLAQIGWRKAPGGRIRFDERPRYAISHR